MNKSVSKPLISVINDLYKDRAVNEITMREINSLCLPDIKEYSAGSIIALLKKNQVKSGCFCRRGKCFPFYRAEMGKRCKEAYWF